MISIAVGAEVRGEAGGLERSLPQAHCLWAWARTGMGERCLEACACGRGCKQRCFQQAHHPRSWVVASMGEPELDPADESLWE